MSSTRDISGGRGLITLLSGRRSTTQHIFKPERISPSKARTAVAATKTETDSADLGHQLRALRVVMLVIAGLGAVVFLRLARDILIPLVAAIVIAAVLGPVTNAMRRFVPNALAAAAAIIVALAVIGATGYLVADDLAVALEKLPEVSRQLKDRVTRTPSSASNPVKKIAEAAQNLEDAATAISNTPPAPTPGAPTAAQTPASRTAAPVPAAAAEPRPSWIRSQLLLGSTTIFQAAGELTVAMLVAYFILASGPVLQRKFLRASGNSRRQRVRVRRILLQSCQQVRLYVLIVLVTNIAIGLTVWPLFYLLGYEHAGLWAAFAGVIHVVPYVGSMVLAGASAVFYYIDNPVILPAINVGFLILVVAALVGTLLPTWLQSRTSRMNQAAVFVGIMFWGWMWGLWGLFLGAPVVVILKVICDNTIALRGAARFLGD